MPVYNGPLAGAIDGNTGPSAIMDAWNGAALDTSNNRLIVFGAGHQDYYGYEVYAFSLTSLTWSELSQPSDLGGSCANSCIGPTLPDGQPTAVHTYDSPNYIPALNAVFSMAGATNIGYRYYWLFSNRKWLSGSFRTAAARSACRASSAAELGPFVDRLARRIASFPPTAIAHANASVLAAETDVREGLIAEARAFDACVALPGARQRMAAFLAMGGQTRELESNSGAFG